MLKQPLDRNDHLKLLIFALLLVPTLVLVVGIIPAVFLAFGLYLMKNNQDFSSVDTAVKVVKGYLWLIAIGSLLLGIIFVVGGDSDGWLGVLLGPSIAIAYLKATQMLFYDPLKNHREWVEVNGVFSTITKSADIEIIKGEKLRQYSVADELLKWAKLKEDGHISEDEFNKARAKLLKRKLQ